MAFDPAWPGIGVGPPGGGSGGGTGGSGSGTGGSGGGAPDSPVERPFAVGPPIDDPLDGFGDIDLASLGLIEWAVPSLVLSVPGILLVLVVLAQASGGILWVPVARRWLGGFGVRRRRTARTAES